MSFALLVVAALVVVPSFADMDTSAARFADDYPTDWEDLAGHEAQYRKKREVVRALSANPRHHRLNLTCGDCEHLAEEFFLLIQNGTKLNNTFGRIARAICRAKYTHDPKKAADCVSLADDAVYLVHHFGVEFWHWKINFKEITCADVEHLCIKKCCDSPHKPEQVRLSFADNRPVSENASWNVAWTTLNNTADAAVYWWPAGVPSQLRSSNATWRTYTDGGWIGVVHVATMTGLTPETEYHYQVGSQSCGLSHTFSFSTMPLNVGTPARPLRVVGLADMGWGPNANYTIQALKGLVEQRLVDFVIHPGDIGYADGDTHWWDYFLREMEPITSRIPYMTVQGNHEQIWWNATGYKVRFAMPEPGYGAPNDGTYYAFEAGPVSFFMLDSESVLNTPHIGPVQVNWASQRMQAYRAKRKFIFTNHHRPMYCSSYCKTDCEKFAGVMRGFVEDVYMKYDVGAVMCGHVHNYERTYPVFNGSVVSKNYTHPHAPVYFVNGAAGNREGQAQFYTNENPWSVLRTMDRGFLQLQFVQETEDSVRMSSQFVRSRDGSVVDTVDLVKKV